MYRQPSNQYCINSEAIDHAQIVKQTMLYRESRNQQCTKNQTTCTDNTKMNNVQIIKTTHVFISVVCLNTNLNRKIQSVPSCSVQMFSKLSVNTSKQKKLSTTNIKHVHRFQSYIKTFPTIPMSKSIFITKSTCWYIS